MNNKKPREVIDIYRGGWRLNYWCEMLGVTAEDLKELIKKYGHDADVLRQKVKGPR